MRALVEHMAEAASGHDLAAGSSAARRLLEGVLDSFDPLALSMRTTGSLTEARRAEQLARRLRLTLDDPDATRRMHVFTRGLYDAPSAAVVYERALDGAISLLGADSGSLQTTQEADGGLMIAAESGFSSEFLEYFAVVRRGDRSGSGRAPGRRAQRVIADIRADAGCAAHRGIAVASGFRGVLSTPLVQLAGDVHGVISTYFAQTHRPSRRELEIMQWYADHITAALTQTQGPSDARPGNAAVPWAELPNQHDAATFALCEYAGLLLPRATRRRRSREPHRRMDEKSRSSPRARTVHRRDQPHASSGHRTPQLRPIAGGGASGVPERQLAMDLPRALEHTTDAVLACDSDGRVTVWNRAAERMFGWTAEEAIGRQADSLISPPPAEKETAAWEDETIWYGRRGKAVIAEHLSIALTADEQDGGYVFLMREPARVSQEDAIGGGPARRQAQLAALGRHALDTEPPHLLRSTTRLVPQGVGADFSYVVEIRDAHAPADRAELSATRDALLREPWAHDPLAEYTIAVGTPVVSADVASDPRFELPLRLAERRMRSAAAVLITTPRRPFGALIVAARQPHAFSSEEIDFLQNVANILGFAVERARTEPAIEAARQVERSRIARDLHDDVLYELSDALARATIRQARRSAGQDDQTWTEQTAALQRLGRQIRSAVYDLSLDAREGHAFVDLLVALIATQDGLAADCRVELRGRDRLPPNALGRRGTQVLRIVREAITNARRHSGATVIRLDASASTPRFLQVEVSDNGRWQDRKQGVTGASGTGIPSMLERAERLSGTLQIQRRPGGGTQVSLRLAMREPEAIEP